jgi:hypothetical protein
MRAIARLLSNLSAPARDAIVNRVMRPLTEDDARALRTVIRRLRTLDPKSAERVRRGLCDRFTPTASTAGT